MLAAQRSGSQKEIISWHLSYYCLPDMAYLGATSARKTGWKCNTTHNAISNPLNASMASYVAHEGCSPLPTTNFCLKATSPHACQCACRGHQPKLDGLVPARFCLFVE